MSPIHSLFDVLFPVRCAACRAAGGPLCAACLAVVRRAPAVAPPPGLDWWVAPFAYEGPVREVLTGLKYRNGRSALPTLVGAVLTALGEAAGAELARVDVVTWPPTTPARRRDRGFDQAEVLAGALAHGLGRPVRPFLTRCAGPSQTGRSELERRGGPVFIPQPVPGLRVLVVDDISTTGATLAAAAQALRAAGARSVGAAAVARTPRRRGADATLAAQAVDPPRRYQN